MNILVTGSLGTIGKPLCKELYNRGHIVYGCDLIHTSDVNYRRCDISHYRQISDLIAEYEPDYVINLAAEFGRANGEDYYENLWNSNVVGMKNLLELQNIYDFRLIHASSSEVYGNTDANPITEETPFSHPQNDYAMTKVVNEWQIKNAREKYSSEVMIPRFFNCYGEGEYYTPYRSMVCIFCYRALMNIPYIVYLGYHRTIMYIDDFIPTLANCVDKFKSGLIVNIGGDEYLEVKQISDEILKQLGKTDYNIHYASEQEHTVKDKNPDISRAREFLHHDPKIRLEEGIARTLAWMKKVYNVS